jgi:hypothetical protein
VTERASDPLLWDTFRNVDRKMWCVYLATEETVPGFAEDLYGITFRDTREIFINVAYTIDEQNETRMHEQMHAARPLDCCETLSANAEERAISVISPKLFPVLKQYCLEWPSRPKGYLGLRRKALRLRREREGNIDE